MYKECKRQLNKFLHEIYYFSASAKSLKPFILLTEERSGGTFFMDLLGAHDNILTDPHDFLSPKRIQEELFPKKKKYTKKPLRGFKVKITESLESLNVENAHEIFCKCMEKEVKIIHLIRRDVLKQCLSTERVKFSNQLHRTKGKAKVRRYVADIENVRHNLMYYSTLKEAEVNALQGVEKFRVYYEDDIEDGSKVDERIDALLAFLGTAPQKLSSVYKKTTGRDVFEEVENADEVRNAVVELTEDSSKSFTNEYLEYSFARHM